MFVRTACYVFFCNVTVDKRGRPAPFLLCFLCRPSVDNAEVIFINLILPFELKISLNIKFCARFSHNSKREVWSLSATPPPSDVTRVVLIYRYQKKYLKNALPSLKHQRAFAIYCFCIVEKFAQICALYRLQNHLNGPMCPSNGILLPLLKLWRGWMGSHILTGLQGNMNPFSASQTTNIFWNIGRRCTKDNRFQNPDWCTLETCTISP